MFYSFFTKRKIQTPNIYLWYKYLRRIIFYCLKWKKGTYLIILGEFNCSRLGDFSSKINEGVANLAKSEQLWTHFLLAHLLFTEPSELQVLISQVSFHFIWNFTSSLWCLFAITFNRQIDLSTFGESEPHLNT